MPRKRKIFTFKEKKPKQAQKIVVLDQYARKVGCEYCNSAYFYYVPLSKTEVMVVCPGCKFDYLLSIDHKWFKF